MSYCCLITSEIVVKVRGTCALYGSGMRSSVYLIVYLNYMDRRDASAVILTFCWSEK